MTVRSYAKINLGLRLLRKRPDGYHDLETVFHRIDLSDEIDVEPAERHLSLRCPGSDLPNDSTNLCMGAAELMRTRAPARVGTAMTLRKGIPVGAGLGGGSSDAAAVLLAVKDLWGLPMSDEELSGFALSLGSDVPYFLRPGSAYATGRGEKLERLDLKLPYWIAVAVPPVSVSTAWAYRHVRIPPSHEGPPLKDLFAASNHDVRTTFAGLVNDFEPLVLSSYPLVADVKRQFLAAGALCALMSGSGAAVFAFFAEESPARDALKGLTAKGCTICLTKPGFSAPVPHILHH